MKQDIWKEGKWIDSWTVNHVLSGILSGSILYIFNISLLWSFIISSVLFVGWEVIEFILKWESLTNQFIDVVANYLGYGIFYYFYYSLNQPFDIKIVFLMIFIFLALEYWGFHAFKLRAQNAKLER